MFVGLLRLGLFATGAFVVLGLLNFIHPALDAMAQFRLHALAALAGLVATAFLARLWLSALAALLVGALAAGLTAPALLLGAVADGPTLRVVQFNLWYRNDDRTGALQVLQNADADVLVLQELVGTTGPLIGGLKQSHPHGIICQARQRPGNVAVLSRLPLAVGGKPYCHKQKAYAQAQIQWQDRTVTVSSLHLSWPWPFKQHQQVSALEKEFDAIPQGALVLAGDYNAAAWTRTVQRVAERVGGAVAANRYFTWGPFHLRGLGRWGQLFSLDQAVLRGFRLKSRKILGAAGSDHRPVLLELVATDD
ncbi:MAG: endonuclease/exonuclease/phosphatase family protein [Pseudomonadota bacterium]